MCLYLIYVLGQPGAQLGISRGCGEVFSYSCIHLREEEEVEELVVAAWEIRRLLGGLVSTSLDIP